MRQLLFLGRGEPNIKLQRGQSLCGTIPMRNYFEVFKARCKITQIDRRGRKRTQRKYRARRPPRPPRLILKRAFSEFDPEREFENARRDDFLDPSEIRRLQPVGVEGGLTGVALREKPEGVLGGARVERVVHFGDDRRAPAAAEPDALVGAQR